MLALIEASALGAIRTGAASGVATRHMARDNARTVALIGAGEFVWRPAGSRHVAWCPNGGTMIAIFQVPNKFFEKDGKVTDAVGKDWQSAWGHVLSN